MSKISKALRELLLARAAGMIDPEEFDRRQAALHAELLADHEATAKRRWWMLGGAISVVALAIGVYAWKTSAPPAQPELPHMLPPTLSGMRPGMPPPMSSAMPPMTGMPPAATGQAPSGASNAGDLNAMAVRLAEKLAKNPTNGEGWALLGQTYMELRQYKEADQAFAKADALGKVDARLREEWTKAKQAAGKK